MGKILTLTSANVTLSNEDIASESLKISESLCSKKTLKFGRCEASTLKLRVRTDQVLLGEKFVVTVTESGSTTTLGTFEVFKDNPTADRCYRDIEASDSMRNIINKNVIDWYDQLSFPMTMKLFRNSFFSFIGIRQQECALPNDNMTIKKTVDATALSGKQIVNAICELNGCFGHISRDGVFQYIFLSNDDPKDVNQYKSCKYEDFTTKAITMIQIRESEGDIGVQVGESGNNYVIENNFLCFGKGTEELTPIATNILNTVRNITYKPYSASLPTDLTTELGRRINISTYASSYVLQRDIKGIQSMFDTISARGTEVFSEQVNGIKHDLIQLKGKSNELERSIEENRLTITNLEGDVDNLSQETSELKQTSSEIKASVSTLEKRIDQEVETVEVDYEPTLYNYPAMDWCTNIPVDGTIPVTDDLHFIYTEEDYRNHLGYVAYGVETNTMYRFTKDSDTGTYYWKPVVNSDMSYVMKKVSELQITVDGIETNVAATYETKDGAQEEYKRLESSIKQTAESITSSVSATYQTKDAMSDYATVTEMSSLFEQTAEAISFTVKKNDVISSINQTAESISIKAEKIDLEGVVNATEFVTKFATIDSLSAVNANVINLEAGMVSISGALSATEARIGKIETNYVSTDYLLVNGKIKADLIDAQVINSKIATISEVNMQRLSCNSYRTSFNNRDYILSPISIQTSSGYYVVLGAKQVMSASLSLSE